jgi:biotin synthase
MSKIRLPTKIRVSVGSAIVLELMKGKLDALPTTVYLLTYHEGKCSANCGFCTQARTSTSRADMLSRVTWPTFPTQQVVSKIASAWQKKTIQRVCIQAINYPGVFDDLTTLTTEIKSNINVPVSASCQPLNKSQMKLLAEAGVNRVSVALDAATEELFNKVKGALACGPYDWEKQKKTLEEAVQVFGKGSVSTHLIVGLGETERQLLEAVQWCADSGVYPSLFAFTPISGTTLEEQPQPSIESYRRVQLARYLIVNEKTRCENMKFNDKERIIDFAVSRHLLKNVVENGSPFQTSGCLGCNRPYYNEKPSGPMYNYPRPLTPNELKEVEKTLEI